MRVLTSASKPSILERSRENEGGLFTFFLLNFLDLLFFLQFFLPGVQIGDDLFIVLGFVVIACFDHLPIFFLFLLGDPIVDILFILLVASRC